jgi:hypothetical protein
MNEWGVIIVHVNRIVKLALYSVCKAWMKMHHLGCCQGSQVLLLYWFSGT